MTREEAIRILDPETTLEALAEIEYYNGFSGKTAAVQAVTDACILAVAAIREQEKYRWIPVTERLPKEQGFYRVYHKNSKAICDRYYYKDCPDLFVNMRDDPITHWKPIEQPPNEG